MSLNIQIYAVRVVTTKQGYETEQIIHFDEPYQTSTHDTLEIIKSPDGFQTYKECVYALGYDEVVPVFKDYDDQIKYDLTGDDSHKIGTKIFNHAIEHVDKLDTWIKECEFEGYTIHFGMV